MVLMPFLRPESIANDTSKSIEYYFHALDFYKQQNRYFDAVLLLQPTSPLRTFELLKNAIEIFKNEK